MKKLSILGLLALSLFACEKKIEENAMRDYTIKKVTEGDFTYETVEGDPMNSRIYTLDNGLKVYMSVYKDAPRIQTYIPVKAGSKNDPANATGLAHYLEHILFKGTSKIGAIDWEKEKPLLDKIEALYEKLRLTTDKAERENIYAEIDKVSGEAATYAAANEYDKFVSNFGAKGTNAYTSFEQTVYVNDIPSNHLEKWLEVEAERFSEVTPRLFHTELEAVYEEKNRSLDNDFSKVWTSALETLFPNHQYGQQTTIGTIEHLKNPSITEIKKYFYKYYVPNNMAICLSGDFDPSEAIILVNKYFGDKKHNHFEPYNPPKEAPFNQNIELEVYGPDAEMLLMGYRLPERNHKDISAIKVLNALLYNQQAGLMDVNLNQKQAVLDAASFQWILNDYGVHFMYATAREGQELSEVKDLITAQLDSIKAGNFENWLVDATINNIKINRMRTLESNRGRANAFVDAFTSNTNWLNYLKESQEIDKVTKDDIIRVAKNYYQNFVTVYKRNGEDPNKQQVEKPKITPVTVNRDTNSVFFKEVMAKSVPEIQPLFLDYSTINKQTINGVNFMYKKNEDNEKFDLYYLVDIGKNNDPKISLAIDYLKYLGTDKYDLEALNKEFYKLGSKYSVFSSEDQIYIRVTGLQDQFEESVDLFEHFLSNVTPNDEALSKLIDGKLKERSDAKLDKSTILYQGLLNYGLYGENNPFTNVLSDEELKNITSNELVNIIKDITNYEHNVLYYGSGDMQNIASAIETKHKVPKQLKPLPNQDQFEVNDITEPTVYWVDYDMVQAEIMMVSKSVKYDPQLLPVIQLYSEYFGGGMGSIVFQEMRESKALAYSVWSRYRSASKKDKNNIILSYIGTQSDKLPEAMAGLTDLINNLPESINAFETAKTAIKNKIASERITKSREMFSYLNAQKLGLDKDIREDIYNKVPKMTFADVVKFQQNFVKGQPQNIVVIGSTNKLDFETLGKYGQVKELTLEQVFGY